MRKRKLLKVTGRFGVSGYTKRNRTKPNQIVLGWKRPKPKTKASNPNQSSSAFPSSIDTTVDDTDDEPDLFENWEEPFIPENESEEEQYWRELRATDAIRYHDYGWYVLPEWDEKKKTLSKKLFCQTRHVDGIYNCTCFSSRHSSSSQQCYHISFLAHERNAFREAVLSMLGSSTSSSPSSSRDPTAVDSSPNLPSSSPSSSSPSPSRVNPPVLLVAAHDKYCIAYVFSVLEHIHSKPAIVWMKELTGRLSCRACDGSSNCQHTAAVRSHLKAENPALSDWSSTEGRELEKEFEEEERIAIQEQKPVSMRPIPVPEWARVESDNLRYSTSPSLSVLPPGSVLKQKQCSHCDSIFNPSNQLSVKLVPTVIYYLNCAVGATLESERQCENCNRLSVYDGLEDHFFNYNNDRLFSHELLNFYTDHYSTHQTSFNSFTDTISNLYLSYKQQSKSDFFPFISNPTFIRVWFSFISLQQWEYSYQCQVCGPHPEAVVADGITLHLPSLYCKRVRSPTVVSPQSEHVKTQDSAADYRSVSIANETEAEQAARGQRQFRFMGNRELAEEVRRYVGRLYERDVIKGRCENFETMINSLNREEPEMANLIQWVEREKKRKELHYQELLPLTRAEPCLDSPSRPSRNRRRTATVRSPSSSTSTPTILPQHPKRIQLALRLLRTLVSDEPLQQFLRFPVPLLVQHLTRNPQLWNDQRVKQILMELAPFIYELFVFFCEEESEKQLPDPFVQLLALAGRRAAQIQLVAEGARGMAQPAVVVSEEFKQCKEEYRTQGSFYGMDQIRHRPVYTRDGRPGLDEVGCNKQFAKQKDMTGGLMVLWCRHRAALGFHVIPPHTNCNGSDKRDSRN